MLDTKAGRLICFLFLLKGFVLILSVPDYVSETPLLLKKNLYQKLMHSEKTYNLRILIIFPGEQHYFLALKLGRYMFEF